MSYVEELQDEVTNLKWLNDELIQNCNYYLLRNVRLEERLQRIAWWGEKNQEGLTWKDLVKLLSDVEVPEDKVLEKIFREVALQESSSSIIGFNSVATLYMEAGRSIYLLYYLARRGVFTDEEFLHKFRGQGCLSTKPDV